MHGRLKVKDKSEIALEKKRKFQEKCRQFKVGLDKSLDLKRQQVYSVDVLRLTGQLLLGHPDVYTLWNYRKETLIHFRDRIINQSNANEKIVFELAAKGDDHEPAEDLVEKGKDSIESIDEFEKLLKNELDLTKQALIKNPKSYCVWQHRFWLLELMQQPAYDKELELCDTYLQQDGRNFHCWDYRNLISAKLKRTVEQELEFSLQKIQQNLSAFSYSTLFYRSSIYIKGAKEKQIDLTEHWDREYSLIENALFTEPNDQALWFYLRWLLATNFGRNLNATIDASSFITSGSYQKLELLRIVNQSRTGLLIFHFNMNVLSDVLGELQVQMQKTSSKWHRVDCHGDSTLRKIVIYKVGSDRIKKIKMKVTGLEMELDLKSITSNLSIWTNSQVQTLEKPVTNIRSEQLQNLMSLKEFEPNNKWLYLVLSSLTGTDQIGLLQTLKKLDPLRTNYYKDQQSKIILKQQFAEVDPFEKLTYSLESKQLSCLYFTEYLIHLVYLNLSGNHLVWLGRSFESLPLLECLILDSNLIKRVNNDLIIKSLKQLYLQNNCIRNEPIIENIQLWKNLKHVYLFGNDLMESKLDDRSQTVCFHWEQVEPPNEQSYISLHFELQSAVVNSSN